jgi:hypothetical protein
MEGVNAETEALLHKEYDDTQGQVSNLTKAPKR